MKRILLRKLIPALLIFAAVFTLPGNAAATDFTQEPQETEAFTEKPLSKSAVNRSAEYSSEKASTLKEDKTFRTAMAESSLRLFRETVAMEAKGKNVLISPDSILTVLAMLENGAKGAALTELKKAMGGISAGKYNKYMYGFHRRLSRSKDIRYDTADSLWYRKGSFRFRKAYLKKMAAYYKADVYEAPFNSRTVKDINNWAYNHTRGKISSILDRLTPQDRAVLMNAVYFKGSWQEPYQSTIKRHFTNASGKKKKVPMLEGTEHTYLNLAGADGFVKYYYGGTTAFVGLLPPKGTSVKAYAKKLTGSAWLKAYKKRQTTGIDVRTRMPEFSYEYGTSLKTPLSKMGVKRAFSDSADFSGMSADPVCIDDILHKTFIKLDKDGTEAAAVTAVLMKCTSVMEPEKTIKEVYLDRPFVYAIIDAKTGLPLFIGTVNDI